MGEDKIIENTEEKKEEIKRVKREKQYRVTNKNNFPYDLHIGKSCYRLEPRNKIGDCTIINEKQKNHKDMQTVGNKVIIQEVKK